MRRQSAPLDAFAELRAVPDAGWSVIANLIGPLPELHRGQFYGEGYERRFITDCDLVGRHVVELPIGTNARLCPQCLMHKRKGKP